VSDLGRHLAAWIALALWIAYAHASYQELGARRGSAGLRTLNALGSLAILAALVWSGWPS
jgi:hypothetical protein